MVLAVTAPGAQASAACPDDDVVPTRAGAPQAVTAIVCDINAIRAKHDLRPLRWDWRLWWTAQRYAGEMAAAQSFSHTAPDGSTLADRLHLAGYAFVGDDGTAVENLGWGKGPQAMPVAMALGWMNSPSHRVNILDPKVRDIGIGMAEGSAEPGGPTGMFYVADFGHRGTPPRSTPARARRSRCARAARRSRTKRAACRPRAFAGVPRTAARG